MSSEKLPPLDWHLGKMRGIFLFDVFCGSIVSRATQRQLVPGRV